jgi:lipid-A-disaccharide synthase
LRLWFGAAQILQAKYPEYEYLVPAINAQRFEQIQKILASYPESVRTKIHILDNQHTESKIGRLVMDASNIVALASGTATLEAMLLHRPMVTFYKLHWLTYRIMKFMIKIPYFSLPNIIAGKKSFRNWCRIRQTLKSWQLKLKN